MERGKKINNFDRLSSLLYMSCLAAIIFAFILKLNDPLIRSEIFADIIIAFCPVVVLVVFTCNAISHTHKRQKSQSIDNKNILKELKEENNLLKQQWQQQMLTQAEELAELFSKTDCSESHKQTKAIDIGVTAWKKGGVECMAQIHKLALEIHIRKNGDTPVVDQIPYWWDGIGNWRNNSIELISMMKGSKKHHYVHI